MHDRDRRRDYGERRDAEREQERPRYGGGWHRGTDYGGRGGYGRYDDRSERDRERMRDWEQMHEREGRDAGRYDYADEGYGGAYRRDRDERWGGSGRRDDDRSGYDRYGEAWRRDAAGREGSGRETNWGSAFNAGEYGRQNEGLGYSSGRRSFEGSEEWRGRPSDRYDERRDRGGRPGEGRYDEGRYGGGREERGGYDQDRWERRDREPHGDRDEERWRFDERPRYGERSRHDERSRFDEPGDLRRGESRRGY